MTATAARANVPCDPTVIARDVLVNGYAVIESAFPRGLIADLHAGYLAHYRCESEEALSERALKVGPGRYMQTVELAPPFDRPALYADSNLLSIIIDLLGPQTTLDGYGLVTALPGAEDQVPHLDHPALFEQASLCAALPPYAITVAIPLVDFGPDTGSTRVWPGTHMDPDPPLFVERARLDPELAGHRQDYPQMGDAFLMDYRLVHCGTANRSQRPRPLLYLIYARDWFSDAVNYRGQPNIVVSKSAFEAVPRELQPLFRKAPSLRHDCVGIQAHGGR